MLFSADPLLLERGECAALIGPNGAGKTTFLRTIMGDLAPLTGQLKLGASLKVGYFAQAHRGLEGNATVLDTLLAARHMTLGAARSWLAHYLFRGEDVYKTLDMLSGGERGRMALALLALQDANLLLLDEPTNHLDIPTQEVLQEVLENFQGTILLVSHDRYLVDRLATQIWELRDARLTVFDGTLAEHTDARRRAAEVAREEAAVLRKETRNPGVAARQQRNEERRRQGAVARAEERVHALEQRQAALAEGLTAASMAQDLDAIRRLGAEHEEVRQELEAALEEWSDLMERTQA